MKLLGDVPERHKEIAKELGELEAMVEARKLPPGLSARACVCMAHDWYKMGADEEGHRLLEKAEAYYPGYFRKLMLQHTLEDATFDYLVKSLSSELATMVLYRLKNK